MEGPGTPYLDLRLARQIFLRCVSHREEVYDGLQDKNCTRLATSGKRFVDVQGSGMMMQFVHVFMNIWIVWSFTNLCAEYFMWVRPIRPVRALLLVLSSLQSVASSLTTHSLDDLFMRWLPPSQSNSRFPRIYRKKCPESSTFQDIDPRPSCEAMDSFSRSFQWQAGGGASFCSKTWNFSESFKSQVWRLALLQLVRLDENLVGHSCQIVSSVQVWCMMLPSQGGWPSFSRNDVVRCALRSVCFWIEHMNIWFVLFLLASEGMWIYWYTALMILKHFKNMRIIPAILELLVLHTHVYSCILLHHQNSISTSSM